MKNSFSFFVAMDLLLCYDRIQKGSVFMERQESSLRMKYNFLAQKLIDGELKEYQVTFGKEKNIYTFLLADNKKGKVEIQNNDFEYPVNLSFRKIFMAMPIRQKEDMYILVMNRECWAGAKIEEDNFDQIISFLKDAIASSEIFSIDKVDTLKQNVDGYTFFAGDMESITLHFHKQNQMMANMIKTLQKDLKVVKQSQQKVKREWHLWKKS